MNEILAILGPTAVGKTRVAIEWAKQLEAEIIAVDSISVYRDFNIGSAKPSLEERKEVRHHLLDIICPSESFTAADFCRLAHDAVRDIFSRKKRVILVGGSGLYFRAFEKGMYEMKRPDPIVKESLEKVCMEKGLPYLYEDLFKKDPETASRVHPNDRYRIIRALEVFYSTGRLISEYRKEHEGQRKRFPYTLKKIGLTLKREALHQAIESRTKKMLDAGLVGEVVQLLKRYSRKVKPFYSVGYKEVLSYLDGHSNGEDLEKEIVSKTKALARRQLTWFRKEKDIVWKVIPEVL